MTCVSHRFGWFLGGAGQVGSGSQPDRPFYLSNAQTIVPTAQGSGRTANAARRCRTVECSACYPCHSEPKEVLDLQA